jgi:hypothetical protein
LLNPVHGSWGRPIRPSTAGCISGLTKRAICIAEQREGSRLAGRSFTPGKCPTGRSPPSHHSGTRQFAITYRRPKDRRYHSPTGWRIIPLYNSRMCNNERMLS